MALAGGISATTSTSASKFGLRLPAPGFRLAFRLCKYSFLLREAYVYFTVPEW
jgi:hypothetical protein